MKRVAQKTFLASGWLILICAMFLGLDLAGLTPSSVAIIPMYSFWTILVCTLIGAVARMLSGPPQKWHSTKQQYEND
ncbi:hypothetical protein [Ruegeria atlantica]|uniref:hypothetical protein n=1 Tax=Ruegeria atlantica TaxID=81569 RepID=UPI00147EBE64|nr:hypothetical protein [Ruegeria atlantica]